MSGSARHASLAALAQTSLVCGLTGPRSGPVSPHTRDDKPLAAKRSAGSTKVLQAEQKLGMTHNKNKAAPQALNSAKVSLPAASSEVA